MAYIPRSSFPQAPGAIPMQIKKKHTIRVFGLLSGIMMFGSLFAVGGGYFYKSYLAKELTKVQSELSALSDSENERKMNEIKEYDAKLGTAESLLDNHIAISRIFDTLEDSAKKTVRFTRVEYTYDPGFEAEVTISGDTRELESVALQKMQMFGAGIFSNFVVSDITSDSVAIEGADLPESKASAEKEGGLASQGVTFEVVGLFKKEPLSFTGTESDTIPVQFTPPTETNDFLNGTSDTTSTDASDITPATATSDNEPTL